MRISDLVRSLNQPMLARLRQCAADTSPNWDGRITIYPAEARHLVALIDAASDEPTGSQVDDLRAELASARTLIRDLADPDPCSFDHHGGCQAHGYLSLEPGEKCPQAEAQELLIKRIAATRPKPLIGCARCGQPLADDNCPDVCACGTARHGSDGGDVR